MIHCKLHFPQYNWEIEIYVILDNCRIDNIVCALSECSQSEIQRAFLNLTTRMNSGFVKTFKNRSIVVINKPTTVEEFINVFNHEKNHLEMHICEEFNIDPHSEEAAELSGNLAKYLFSALMDELFIYYTSINNR